MGPHHPRRKLRRGPSDNNSAIRTAAADPCASLSGGNTQRDRPGKKAVQLWAQARTPGCSHRRVPEGKGKGREGERV